MALEGTLEVREANRAEARRANVAACVVAEVKHPAHGDVRKIHRDATRCQCGATLFEYVRDDDASLYRQSLCDACTFFGAFRLEELAPIQDEHELVAAEFATFEAVYPRLAAILGKQVAAIATALVPEKTRVPLGQRLRPRTGTLNDLHYRAALARHGAGDHGDFGMLADTKPTAHDKIAPDLAAVDVRNSLALEAGHGVIRSRFLHPDEPADPPKLVRRRDAPPGHQGQLTIDVATLLGPGAEPLTVVLLGRRGQHCFGSGC